MFEGIGCKIVYVKMCCRSLPVTSDCESNKIKQILIIVVRTLTLSLFLCIDKFVDNISKIIWYQNDNSRFGVIEIHLLQHLLFEF